MSLKELMDTRQKLQEEEASKTSVLRTVKGGDLSALAPYIKTSPDQWLKLNDEDIKKEDALITEKHLRNESSVERIKEGEDPAKALESTKKWLKDTFPTQQTDALLVQDDKGNYFVARLGVSLKEMDAAIALQIQQRRAAKEAGEIETRIQEKIKEGHQQIASAADETTRALATPAVQRRPAPHDKSVVSVRT